MCEVHILMSNVGGFLCVSVLFSLCRRNNFPVVCAGLQNSGFQTLYPQNSTDTKVELNFKWKDLIFCQEI